MKSRTKIILCSAALVIIIIVLVLIFKKSKPADMPPVSMPATPVTNATPAAPAGNDNFPLNLGSRGDNVKRLQMALNRIRANNNLEIDGVFGPVTKNALLLSVATSLSALPMSENVFNTIIYKAKRA